ncbi:MAG: phospholipid carrier-dependent glycosyltransferase [Nitrospirae bacterium]|nr:phospholipid carrier-dependent glycosyltransferase [Nitrospirota bacterium]
MNKLKWKILAIVLVLIFGAFFRFWCSFSVPTYQFDEGLVVPAAKSLLQYGTTTEMQWLHPHLNLIILYNMINVFGDNPYGWRISNIFFGTVSIFLIYLIGVKLYPNTKVPILASCILAFDPFHAHFSRTAFMEIPTSFFFLLFFYFMIEYSENRRSVLVLAGIALGLTVATKAYYFFAIPVVVLYTLYRVWQRGDLSHLVWIDFVVALVILPIGIYLLSYFHWFGRGYTLPEFFAMKMDAIWLQQNFSLDDFEIPWYIEVGGKPWQWFLRPFISGHQIFSDGENGRFLLEINNPPFRLMVIPSLILVSVYAWRTRTVQELLAPMLFVVCYFIFLIVDRPLFSSNSVVLLPFAYLAVASAVVIFARWLNREKQVYSFFIFGVVAWGLYTFPLISGELVPISFYRPLISIASIIRAYY